MTVLFRKCLHVSLAERSKFFEGEIQTFMSVDAERTVNMSNSFHDMWRFHGFNRVLECLEACALDTDVSLMVGGDMAYIEEKGLNLSGGQSARLALARVVYHGSELVMLDDVLSAVNGLMHK